MKPFLWLPRSSWFRDMVACWFSAVLSRLCSSSAILAHAQALQPQVTSGPYLGDLGHSSMLKLGAAGVRAGPSRARTAYRSW